MSGRIEIATQPTPTSNTDWKRILPGLVISIISLAVVFYFADLRSMLKALELADYRLVALAFGFSTLWLLVRGMVWKTLLQDQATFKQVFFTITEGYLLNNVLPFRLGEVARALLLSQKASLGFFQVASTIVIERALDLAMAAGLLLVTLSFVVGATWARTAALVAAGLVLAGFLVLYIAARNRERVIAWYERLSAHWALLRRIGGGQLTAFFSGLAVLTDGSLFLRTIGWVLLNWGVAIFQYYLLLMAFFPNPKFLWAAFALGVGALGIAAPSSPGAVGVLELSIVGALAIFGLDHSTALAYALTAHLFNYVTNGAFGAYALMKDGESLTGIYRRVRHIPQEKIS